MAATVISDIRDAMITRIAAVLPAEWRQARRWHDASLNDSRTGDRGYAVRVLSGSAAESITRNYTVDQTFEVIFIRKITDRGDDQDFQDVIDDVYEQTNVVVKSIFLNRLGLTTADGVLAIFNPSWSEPEVGEHDLVIQRVQFTVKWRRSID